MNAQHDESGYVSPSLRIKQFQSIPLDEAEYEPMFA